MQHYYLEMLYIEKQKEIEKSASEAWKFVDFKKETLFQKGLKKLKSFQTPNKTVCNLNARGCEC